MLLLLPIMAWNWKFVNKLPRLYSAEYFEKDIPPFVSIGENSLRLVVFILPAFMPLNGSDQIQKLGLWLYFLGVSLYFVSWLAQIIFPQSSWSLSAPGFLAPAYTPLIWLAGIGLIGKTVYFPFPYQAWMYLLISTVFVGFHFSHALIVYLKNTRIS